MSEEFHKPTQYSGDKFDTYEGGEDPAQISRVAHESARMLVDRARETEDPAVLARLVAYTDDHGVDALAELWARSSAKTLPGALWRLYLMRVLIRQDPTGTSMLYQRGSEVLHTIDPVVAGATSPSGPEEIIVLADEILRGLFIGDFGTALDRAAAFCRVAASGAMSLADDAESTLPQRSSELTARAARLAQTAAEFTACAHLHRSGRLD